MNIYIAGHRGMVGSAITRYLERDEDNSIVTTTHNELDLTNQADVLAFFRSQNIDQVYLAAAKVGGIMANNLKPAEFIFDNLMIEANVINSAFLSGVKKLLFLGTSSIYPKLASQPILESSLLTGSLEPTNEPYAIAKIAGIKLCESYNRQYGANKGVDFRCVMPTNLYGPGDNYHPETSHVIPGMIYKFHCAKINDAPFINLWGTGNPMREFLYVDDMASACVHVMNINKKQYEHHVTTMASHINVGFGSDITISDLARLVGSTVGFRGEIRFDKTKPDGVAKKLLDSSKLKKMGWNARVCLEAGLKRTYQDFLTNN